VRLIKREVNGTLSPIRNPQSPTLGEVLADGSYQRILQRFTHRLRDGIDALLLGNLVGMIEVELVREFVKRDGHRQFVLLSHANYIISARKPLSRGLSALCSDAPCNDVGSIQRRARHESVERRPKL